MQSNRRAILRYAAASLGIGLFFGFNDAVLPLFLARFTGSAIVIGGINGLRPLTATVVQPLAGAWSDRLQMRWGRRRPFLLVSIPLCAAFLVATPLSPGLGAATLAIALYGIFFNLAFAPYQALLADLFPAGQRAMVSAAASVLNLLGQASIAGAGALLVAAAPTGVFVLVAAGLLAAFAITALPLREPALSGRPSRPLAAGYWRLLRSNVPALRYIASQWAIWFGINTVAPFLTLFVVRVYGVSETYALLGFLLLVLASGGFALPAARAADRWGKVAVLSAGLLLFIASAAGVLLIPRFEVGVALLLVAGAANAIVNVLGYPLLTELVPAEEVGAFTGLNQGLQSAAVPLAFLSAGALVDTFGYSVIFVVLIAASIVSLALLRLVRA